VSGEEAESNSIGEVWDGVPTLKVEACRGTELEAEVGLVMGRSDSERSNEIGSVRLEEDDLVNAEIHLPHNLTAAGESV